MLSNGGPILYKYGEKYPLIAGSAKLRRKARRLELQESIHFGYKGEQYIGICILGDSLAKECNNLMILLKWRLEICKAYLELIQIVRSKYPGALIFCILASVFQVMGVPQNGWFTTENPWENPHQKWMITGGIPYFQTIPNGNLR